MLYYNLIILLIIILLLIHIDNYYKLNKEKYIYLLIIILILFYFNSINELFTPNTNDVNTHISAIKTLGDLAKKLMENNTITLPGSMTIPGNITVDNSATSKNLMATDSITTKNLTATDSVKTPKLNFNDKCYLTHGINDNDKWLILSNNGTRDGFGYGFGADNIWAENDIIIKGLGSLKTIIKELQDKTKQFDTNGDYTGDKLIKYGQNLYITNIENGIRLTGNKQREYAFYNKDKGFHQQFKLNIV